MVETQQLAGRTGQRGALAPAWRRQAVALMQWTGAAAACAGVALGAAMCAGASAHPSSSSAAPARAAAPARSFGGGLGGGGRFGGGGAGGAPHLPSGMAGAHVPGSMGGAHVPSGMAGAHVPGSMGGAHMPSSMRETGGAHVPGSVNGAGGHMQVAHNNHMPATRNGGEQGEKGSAAGRHGEAEHGEARRDEGQHGEGQHGEGQHGEARQEGAHRDAAGTREAGRTDRHETPEETARHTAFQHDRAFAAGRHDVRLGGSAHLNTRGLEAGLRVHAAPRPFLHADAHRDIAGDRAFTARHANDFHTRHVRDFTPRELAAWRGGLWRNEWHYGRRGWWWDVDGVWYDYPEPIWPYPEDVAALTVYETPVIDGPDMSAEEGVAPVAVGIVTASGDAPVAAAYNLAAAPAADAAQAQAAEGAQAPAADAAPVQIAAADIPPLPAAPAGWYHCGGPMGYYPGVNACGPGWELVQTAPMPGEQ